MKAPIDRPGSEYVRAALCVFGVACIAVPALLKTLAEDAHRYFIAGHLVKVAGQLRGRDLKEAAPAIGRALAMALMASLACFHDQLADETHGI